MPSKKKNRKIQTLSILALSLYPVSGSQKKNSKVQNHTNRLIVSDIREVVRQKKKKASGKKSVMRIYICIIRASKPINRSKRAVAVMR